MCGVYARGLVVNVAARESGDGSSLHREKGETLMIPNEVYKSPTTYPRAINLTRVSQGPHWSNNALCRQYKVSIIRVHFAWDGRLKKTRLAA